MQGKSMPTATMEISGSRVQNALAACKTLELEQSKVRLELWLSTRAFLRREGRNLIYYKALGCSKQDLHGTSSHTAFGAHKPSSAVYYEQHCCSRQHGAAPNHGSDE